MVDDDPVHVSELVVGSKGDQSRKKVDQSPQKEQRLKESETDHAPQCKSTPNAEQHCSQSCDNRESGSHDHAGVVSPDIQEGETAAGDADDEVDKRTLSRSRSELEEFERQRAKKIVIEAIKSEQSKESVPETRVDSSSSSSSSPHHSSVGRVMHAGKNGGDVAVHHDVSRRANNEEVTTNNLENGESILNVTTRAPCDVNGQATIKTHPANRDDSNGESSISVSSRVKRFSVSDEKVEASSNRAIASPGSPLTDRATTSGAAVVIRRKDPEVKRSVLSVTVTTSEDDCGEGKVSENGVVGRAQRPVTQETENIVWRVRSRRKLKERANLSNGS